MKKVSAYSVIMPKQQINYNLTLTFFYNNVIKSQIFHTPAHALLLIYFLNFLKIILSNNKSGKKHSPQTLTVLFDRYDPFYVSPFFFFKLKQREKNPSSFIQFSIICNVNLYNKSRRKIPLFQHAF